MSDAVQDQVVDNTSEVTQSESNQSESISLESLKQEMVALQEFSKKNRDENADYRKRNRELKRELEAYKSKQEESSKKSMEEQGQYKALWEKEKSEKEAALKAKEDMFMNVQAEKLSSQFKDLATSHGCTDPSLAFITANNKYQDMIDFNPDTLQANPDSLSAVVEKMRLDHPALFKAGPLSVKDGNPSKVKNGPKSLEDMSDSELAKLLAEQLKGQS